MGIFNKLAIAFRVNRKDNMYLPEATKSSLPADSAGYVVSPYKTLASFDLSIEKPKYSGAIPEATIKFYPLD